MIDAREAADVFIGIDLGGTNLKAVAIDREGTVLTEKKAPARTERGPSAVIDSMIELIVELSGQAGGGNREGAVGIAAAGVVDAGRGVCIWLPNLPGWKQIAVTRVIQERRGSRCFLINDVRAMTLAEKTVGAGVGVRNLVCMAIGTGIGGGIVINDTLYFGSEGFAGEIGHQLIDPQGPKCTCGNYGCLETVASGASIVFQAIRMVKQGATTLIRDLANNDLNQITPELVAEAAYSGDAIATEIWNSEAHYLGIGIANLVVMLNPEMIILEGGVAKAFDLLIDGIRKTLNSRIHLGPQVDNLRIVPSMLGDYSGAIGAAIWAMRNSGSDEAAAVMAGHSRSDGEQSPTKRV